MSRRYTVIPATSSVTPVANTIRIASNGMSQYEVADGRRPSMMKSAASAIDAHKAVTIGAEDLRDREDLPRRVHLVEQWVPDEARPAARHRVGEERPRKEADVEEDRVPDTLGVDLVRRTDTVEQGT